MTGSIKIDFFDLDFKVKSRANISMYVGKFTAEAFRDFLANTESDTITLDF